MKKMSVLDWIFLILLVIGGLNWGLVGVAEFDLVAEIFGDMSTVSRIVYAVVGVSALWVVIVMPMKSSAGNTANPTI